MRTCIVGQLVLAVHPKSGELHPAELLKRNSHGTWNLPLGRVLSKTALRADGDEMLLFWGSGELQPKNKMPQDPIR
jgi:hypothetical protein